MSNEERKSKCSYLGEEGKEKPCGKPAEWQLWSEGANPYEFTDACTDHVGALLEGDSRVIIHPEARK